MQSIRLDFRGESPTDTGVGLMAAYNHATPGSEFKFLCDSSSVHLRMRMIEGGLRYQAERGSDGGWQIKIRRGKVPAQGKT